MFCGCSAKARKAQRLCWHQELLVPGLVSRVIPNFLRPQEKWWRRAVPSCISSPCKQDWKPTFRWEKPFCNQLCFPKQQDRIYSLGRQIPGCPRLCLQRSSLWGTAENQWAGRQAVLTDLVFGGLLAISPFRHLTHHLAAAWMEVITSTVAPRGSFEILRPLEISADERKGSES